MLNSFDIRFFATIAEVADALLGVDHACTTAARAAVKSRDPQDLRMARTCIDNLPADQHDGLMAETHRRLATEFSAIWDQLPDANPDGRMN